MAGRILVPLDGSSIANRALRYAVALARERQVRLLLARVLEPTAPRGLWLTQEPGARRELERVATELSEENIDVTIEVSSTLFGTVPNVLIDLAGRHGCELIVMSTHGRSGMGRWLYGTVAEDVLRRSPLPVLLVSPTCDRLWQPGRRLRVLVPIDGSPAPEEAIEPMLTSLGQLAREVIVLQVAPPTAVPAVYGLQGSNAATSAERCVDFATRLQQRGLQVTESTEEGSPEVVISRIAAEQDVDLIAMRTHGRSGIARVALGSVSTETMHRARVPLLLFSPAALRGEVAPPASNSAEVQARPSERIQPQQPLTVLVAMDLSEKADAALGATASLAHAANARVILLNVFWPPGDMGHVTVGTQEERIEYVQRERQLYLADKARALPGVDVTTRVEVQSDGEEVDECITRVASELHADVLVVVSKRVSGGVSAVLGSFAQGILRLSPCPVLVVRPVAESRDHSAQ
jgi:nucleotide-binding universal stress UspA family protein